jgi:hypothetical protein
MILFVLVSALLMGLAAIVIDVGVLRRTGAELASAVDAGAFAGGAQLPANAANAAAITASAVSYINSNDPGAGATSTWVSYVCLVGDRNIDGLPDISSDIPAVCDPGAPTNAVTMSPPWKCAAGICSTPCNPLVGSNKCNVIVVSGAQTSQYTFGRVVGVNSGSTGTIQSAACRGACGGSPSVPVDAVLVMDRTSSMSGANTTAAKAAADSIRTLYNPASQWLGLGTLGPSKAAGGCATAPDAALGSVSLPASLSRWIPVALSGTGAPVNEDYTSSTSAVAKGISCYTNSSTGTDLSDPVTMAQYELTNYGRAGVSKGIILETDGQPNASFAGGTNFCAQSDAAATTAKNAGIEIFTIGFGLDPASGGDPACPDTSGPWKGKTATQLLASMSTQPTLGTTTCTAIENTDGDHFFCEPKSGDLSAVFKTVATTFANGTHLLALP